MKTPLQQVSMDVFLTFVKLFPLIIKVKYKAMALVTELFCFSKKRIYIYFNTTLPYIILIEQKTKETFINSITFYPIMRVNILQH